MKDCFQWKNKAKSADFEYCGYIFNNARVRSKKNNPKLIERLKMEAAVSKKATLDFTSGRGFGRLACRVVKV